MKRRRIKKRERSGAIDERGKVETSPVSPVPAARTRTRSVGIVLGFLVIVVGVSGMAFRALDVSREENDPGSSGASSSVAESFCGVQTESADDVAVGPQPPGTMRMLALLERARQEQARDPSQSAYMSRQLVEVCRRELAEATDPEAVIGCRFRLAVNLLRAGQSVAALEELDGFEEDAARRGITLDARQESRLREFRAVCNLRIGEQENCLSNHTSESCLLPIRGEGVHLRPSGSEAAIELLERQLTEAGLDLRNVWLLNVAYMTLGKYPDEVPEAWRIPPRVFESDYELGRYPDVAGEVGLAVDGLAGGAILEDFDRDGYLDAMVSDWSLRGQLRFFENRGDGTFREVTRRAGLQGMVGGLNIMQTDYDNDGYADVFVTRGAWLGKGGRHPNSLLRNQGDGTFSDVTEQAGLLSFHPTQTAVWLDYDADGWLDLFIGNESSVRDRNPCELYRNNGDGTFTECAAALGVAVVRFVKGVASGDYDNDGRPDLYLSLLDGANVLLRNEGPTGESGEWRFRDMTVVAGVSGPLSSFPTWFFDYDNDGWLDLFVCDYGAEDAGAVLADYLGREGSSSRAGLYHNNRDGTFTDRSRAVGLDRVLMGMGANFGDLDNDGWLDLYVGTGNPDLSTIIPNRMFRNDAGARFQDVTTSGGFGHLQKGHGVSFGDVDNDGDQDVLIKMGGAYSGDNYRSSLFRNPGQGNHWITLQLEGVRSNRAAVGARIRLVVDTPAGERVICKTVTTGGSFGASPLRQEIGLGQASRIISAEVDWPATGEVQRVVGLARDRFYHIREGESRPVEWDMGRRRVSDGAVSGPGRSVAGRKGKLAWNARREEG